MLPKEHELLTPLFKQKQSATGNRAHQACECDGPGTMIERIPGRKLFPAIQDVVDGEEDYVIEGAILVYTKTSMLLG